jgi:nucleoside 2-deoxyribosyltransferase
MSKPKVYLAGPITGLTFEDAQGWRDIAARSLAPEINAFSPLRNKTFLSGRGAIHSKPYLGVAMATDRGIMTRDHWDCLTADLILVNFLGARYPSIGTAMEIGFAFAYRKPVVAIMEHEGNVHDHGMIREAIGYRTHDFDEALEIVRAILLPH